MPLLLPARYSSPKVLTPLHYSSGQTALKPFHPMEWNRFAGFLCSCDLREEPRAGQVWFPSPCGFFPAFLGVLGGGEAKGRWPLLRRRQQFVPWPWRWARGTRVWIPPKEGRSHRSSSKGLPQERLGVGSPISSTYTGQLLAIKMKTRQCLCSVTAGTWFRAQSKTWVLPEFFPLLFLLLFAESHSCLVAFVSPRVSGSEGAPDVKH